MQIDMDPMIVRFSLVGKSRFVQHYLKYVLFGAIALLSFLFYSYLRYPALNSDHAVIVLMAADYHVPDNLFFWGQDRYGSIVPLLSQPLILLGLSAIWATSIIQYSILFAGFLAATSFIRSRFLQVCLAIIWFFPPAHFLDWLGFYAGLEYALFFIGFYFIRKRRQMLNLTKLKRFVYTVIASLCLIMAVWVCDIALVSIGLFVAIQFLFYFKKQLPFFKTISIQDLGRVLGYAIAFVIGCLFINYAKGESSHRIDYVLLMPFSDWGKTWTILLSSLSDFFLFKANEPFTSVYLYFVVILIAVIIYNYSRTIFKLLRENEWLAFFLADAIIVTTVLMCCNFTLENNVPRRYFTFFYIGASMSFLMVLDNLHVASNVLDRMQYFLLSACCVAGVGGLYNLKYVWPQHLEPRTEQIRELDSLGKCGIIGDYWNSYIYMCMNPDSIKATPYMYEQIRNHALRKETFEQEELYLARDMWMDNFPDTVKVQSDTLVKIGSEFYLAKAHLCQYRLLSK